jgi:hypothetical protein
VERAEEEAAGRETADASQLVGGHRRRSRPRPPSAPRPARTRGRLQSCLGPPASDGRGVRVRVRVRSLLALTSRSLGFCGGSADEGSTATRKFANRFPFRTGFRARSLTSRRPLISSSPGSQPVLNMYTYAARVWDSSLVQGTILCRPRAQPVPPAGTTPAAHSTLRAVLGTPGTSRSRHARASARSTGTFPRGCP